MWQKRLSRDDAWRLAYRVRPYLTEATQAELEARTADILRNLYTLTPEGKIGALAPDNGGLLWLQKFSDVALEYYRRNQNIERTVRPEDIPFNRAALDLVRSNEQLAPNARRRPVFCRFSESKWVEALADRGELLLSPASYYRAKEHGFARHDDELAIETYVSPYDYDLGTVAPTLAGHFKERSWGVIKHQKPCDHYIYCVTVSFDFRYFLDFGTAAGPAEACLLIHDQDEFERRLTSAVRAALPGWHVSFDMVKYIDPYFMPMVLPNREAELFYFKHFRFMYQRECRLVALPSKDTTTLERLLIRLGSLEDISQLIHLAS